LPKTDGRYAESKPCIVWKRKYQGMNVAEIKRLETSEEENAKLKKLLAEQMLLNEGLKDVLAKKC
jgi:putative transposase